jgi:hypothetical protein
LSQHGLTLHYRDFKWQLADNGFFISTVTI